MKSSSLLTLLAFSVAAFIAPASAVPITFTYSGTGSGSIGGNAFASSAFTISAVGDTETVIPAIVPFIYHASATINIAGVGTFSFSTPTQTSFSDSTNAVGFGYSGRFAGSLFYSPSTPLLDGWDMTTSVGPIGGNFNLVQWNYVPIITSGGVLLFNTSSGPGTFSASVGGLPVPDSSSTLLLLVAGFAAIGTFRRKLQD
jgi:hypothetical protein